MGAVDTELGWGWDEARQEGIEVGQLRVLSHLVARKFGRRTSEELERLLGRVADGDRIDRVAAAVMDCNAADEFLARVRAG